MGVPGLGKVGSGKQQGKKLKIHMSVRPVSNTFYCCQYLAGAIQPLTCLCALEIWALLCLLLPRSFLKNLLPLLAQGEGI